MMVSPRRRAYAVSRVLEMLAHRVTRSVGGSWAFGVAGAVIVVWAASGPLFHFSDTWQLVINTGTTIITFLMVFLIQRSQNKDAQAIHLKLNEIVAALAGASNRLINVEDLTEDEARTLHQHYQRLVVIAKRDDSLTQSHSVEEADTRHRAKKQRKEHIMAGAPPLPSGDEPLPALAGGGAAT